jgi:hypothetical protein
MTKLHYDYTNVKDYCERIGLAWLGDEAVVNSDEAAHEHGFTQEQVDVAFWHMLWHVKWLFTPQNYTEEQRGEIAAHFLEGTQWEAIDKGLISYSDEE